MSRRSGRIHELMTASQSFDCLKVDDLRPLAALIADTVPTRKTELVPLLANAMVKPTQLRELYEQLDPVAQNAVRSATHDEDGMLDTDRFEARYGSLPKFNTADPNRTIYSYSYAEQRKIKPTLLRLFFPRFHSLPTDTQVILREFVPQPDSFKIATLDAPPETFPLKEYSWEKGKKELHEWDEPIRFRETAHEAEADLIAVLRLIDSGKLRVTDKKLVPTEATQEAVAGILTGGDLFTSEDEDDSKYDPAFDLNIRSHAWPLLVQAGGLAEKSGAGLKLTAAGKRALLAPPSETLRKLWASWVRTKLYDEFARVEVIKGQGSARMSSAAGRREVLVEGLSECPPERWFAVNDYFRFLRATGKSFVVAQNEYDLYIAEHHYGNLGYDDGEAWEQLQGRFILTFLMEYAATLGLVDIAYLPPQGMRSDYSGRWGTDDLSCLSRYDGLLYVRINSLGAWILGLTKEYKTEAPKRVEKLRILANLDIVATGTLSASDRLVLDRFAEPTSEGVWKLSTAKINDVLEQSGKVEELEQFLTSRSTGEFPETVSRFLADLRTKASRLADAGPCRLIACADEFVAAELCSDRQLKGKCLRAGDHFVAVRDADLPVVRKVVRKLGYVWPLGGE